ncbi:hypothetical protein HQ520_18585 [bacterium]|nr:hypothetical protein [bacterium]
MHGVTTHDILGMIRDFHTLLSDYFEERAVGERQEEVKMLLSCMSRHERRLEKKLARYETGDDNAVAPRWPLFVSLPKCRFRFPPAKGKCNHLAEVNLTRPVAMRDVTKALLCCDRCLEEFYGALAEKSETHQARHLFNRLLHNTQREEKRFSRSSLDL